MSGVCNEVCTELTLQPLTGEVLAGASAITEMGARIDFAANGFWGGCYERTYFNVKCLLPCFFKSPAKPCFYLQKTWKVQNESIWTVHTWSGTWLLYFFGYITICGMWCAATVCFKRLACYHRVVICPRLRGLSSTQTHMGCIMQGDFWPCVCEKLCQIKFQVRAITFVQFGVLYIEEFFRCCTHAIVTASVSAVCPLGSMSSQCETAVF